MPEAEAPEPQSCRRSLLQTHRRVFCPARAHAVEDSGSFLIFVSLRLSSALRSARPHGDQSAMLPKQGLLGQIDAIGAEAFHILLVEDDQLTLKVTEGLLRHCNYQGINSPHKPGTKGLLRTVADETFWCTVTLARNGRQALEALQSPEGEHINLILTDVLMPEVRWLSQAISASQVLTRA